MPSLLPFSNPPTPASLRHLLPEIVCDVAEQAFFAYVEPLDSAEGADEKVPVNADASAHAPATLSTGWLCARVRFEGLVNGTLEVRLPNELARELCLALGGRPNDDTPTAYEILDVAGELANMLCGTLLTRAGRQHRFELHPPETTWNAGRPHSNEARCVDDLLRLRINSWPIEVRFDVQPG